MAFRGDRWLRSPKELARSEGQFASLAAARNAISGLRVINPEGPEGPVPLPHTSFKLRRDVQPLLFGPSSRGDDEDADEDEDVADATFAVRSVTPAAVVTVPARTPAPDATATAAAKPVPASKPSRAPRTPRVRKSPTTRHPTKPAVTKPAIAKPAAVAPKPAPKPTP